MCQPCIALLVQFPRLWTVYGLTMMPACGGAASDRYNVMQYVVAGTVVLVWCAGVCLLMQWLVQPCTLLYYVCARVTANCAGMLRRCRDVAHMLLGFLPSNKVADKAPCHDLFTCFVPFQNSTFSEHSHPAIKPSPGLCSPSKDGLTLLWALLWPFAESGVYCSWFCHTSQEIMKPSTGYKYSNFDSELVQSWTT